MKEKFSITFYATRSGEFTMLPDSPKFYGYRFIRIASRHLAIKTLSIFVNDLLKESEYGDYVEVIIKRKSKNV